MWQKPTQVLVQSFLSWQMTFQVFENFWNQSISISEMCLEWPLSYGFPADSLWCVLGHVGVPLACNHVKLEDVPDMNYFSVNGEGEVGWLCPVVMSRPTWWACLYQEECMAVSRLGRFYSSEILSKESSVSEPHSSIHHIRDYNRVLITL